MGLIKGFNLPKAIFPKMKLSEIDRTNWGMIDPSGVCYPCNNELSKKIVELDDINMRTLPKVVKNDQKSSQK